MLVMIYAYQRADPVFMLGQLVGVVNYSRNIYLIRRKQALDGGVPRVP
jgi:lipid-A-disaccharide synthase-like uncharacterized protein